MADFFLACGGVGVERVGGGGIGAVGVGRWGGGWGGLLEAGLGGGAAGRGVSEQLVGAADQFIEGGFGEAVECKALAEAVELLGLVVEAAGDAVLLCGAGGGQVRGAAVELVLSSFEADGLLADARQLAADLGDERGLVDDAEQAGGGVGGRVGLAVEGEAVAGGGVDLDGVADAEGQGREVEGGVGLERRLPAGGGGEGHAGGGSLGGGGRGRWVGGSG